MSDSILVLNAGSSSIKFSLFPGHERPMREDLICEGECDGIGHEVRFTANDGKGAVLIDETLRDGTTHEDALAALLRWLDQTFPRGPLIAARHRVSMADRSMLDRSASMNVSSRNCIACDCRQSRDPWAKSSLDRERCSSAGKSATAAGWLGAEAARPLY